MDYGAQLDFLRRTLEKMRIQTALIGAQDMPNETLDFGLRKFLGHGEEYIRSFRDMLELVEENTVYKLSDEYRCKYIFFILPRCEPKRSLLLGPYLSDEIGREEIMETTERFGIPVSRYRQLENYYAHIPVITDDAYLLIMINTLAETMWGSAQAYKIVDFDSELSYSAPVAAKVDESADSSMQMKLMESRYAYENELMETVAKGHVHRAALLISRPSQKVYEQRVSDPLRNQKNYCIICNTLMRKAAEKGGVHPVHLDSLSSAFAKKIELLSSASAGNALINDMVQEYCLLVKRYNIKKYSLPVQKTITYVEMELAGDLSLDTLASLNNVSASYLSSLFHKETGTTLIDFITRKRIEHGAQLLLSTKLQVQTIAEHCGISDAGYFARLFKKYHSLSPKQFREQQGK